MASKLIASDGLQPNSYGLIAMASNPIAMASNLIAMASYKQKSFNLDQLSWKA